MAAGKVAQEAIVEAAEFVSEEADQVADVTRALSSRDTGFLFGGLGIGVVVGFAGGYYFLKKKMELKYEAVADSEISAMREHYTAKRVSDLAQQEKAQPLSDVVTTLGYKPPAGETGKVPYHQMSDDEKKALREDQEQEAGDDADENVTNLFNKPSVEVSLPDWDQEEEESTRTNEIPYVIHKDEYTAGHPEHEQHTLTYFEGDDVLGDERDRVIEDQDATIGIANLSKFGHGSGDSNIVYIRNHEMKVDIEVVHSNGKFATEVHGFQDDELQHSSMRRRSPRRSDHDSSD